MPHPTGSYRFNIFQFPFLKYGIINDHLTDLLIKISGLSAVFLSLWAGIWQYWHLAIVMFFNAMLQFFLVPIISKCSAPEISRLVIFLIHFVTITMVEWRSIEDFDSVLLTVPLVIFPGYIFYPSQWLRSLTLSSLILFLIFETLWNGPSDIEFYQKLTGRELFDLSIKILVFFSLFILVTRVYKKSAVYQKRNLSQNLRFKNLLNVSVHELSNHMTLVMGTSQVIQSENFVHDPIKIKMFMEKVERASEAIDGIITNIRAFEALQEPKRINLKAVRLIPVLETVCDAFCDRLHQKQIFLHKDYQIDFNKHAYMDSYYFSLSCFKRVMYNAIRFSREKSEIHLKVYENESKIFIEVEDQGPGIEPETKKKLYQFDFMVNLPGKFGEKGSGFSLSIANLMIQEMGGELRVSSPLHLENQSGSFGTKITLILRTAAIN